MNSSDVQIVMIPRERYLPTISSLRHLLASTPTDIPIVLVRGGMSDRIVRAASKLGGHRLRVVGPHRHLSPNVARAIGLDEVTSKYVVFVDNDISCDSGWLQPLLDTAERFDAWVVRPVILQRVDNSVTIHEAGGDCRLEQHEGSLRLVENHRFHGESADRISHLETEEVEMFEFHTVLFHRDRLLSLGGPDEAMLATAEHIDLAIRIQEAGGSIWIEPSSSVVYDVPSKVTMRDLSFFLGRWSPEWTARTQVAFTQKHRIDADSSHATWNYPHIHRRYAWKFINRIARVLLPRGSNSKTISKMDTISSRAIDKVIGRYIADACLRFTPRWQGDGLRGGD